MENDVWMYYLSRERDGGGHECIIAIGTRDTESNCIDAIEASATEGIGNQSKYDGDDENKGSQPSGAHRIVNIDPQNRNIDP